MLKSSSLLIALTLVFAQRNGIAAKTQSEPAAIVGPEPEIFAPGVLSGAENDGSPTFSPDGKMLYFTRSATRWTVIMESQLVGGKWSKPVIAPFSGEWPDSSPAMSPDGSYVIFQSNRPVVQAKPGAPAPHAVSNLWRVDRTATGWSKPMRLPDAVNIGHSIWKPSVAADGTVYLTFIDDKGNKRLYASAFKDGAYQQAQPLSFSDGTTLDVDPEVSPDSSFLVFCSSGRMKGNDKDFLYITRRIGGAWGPVVPLRYAGDEKPDGFSTDDEPHLGPDHRTVYFSSDRAVSVHFPRTREQAQRDVDRMAMWDNGNSNIWSLPLDIWLR